MATVRLHFYRGLVQLPKTKSTQFGSDSVLALQQPRIPGGGAITTNTSTVVSSSAAPAGTQVAVLKMDPGVRVYYEVVNNANSGTEAAASSPVAEGELVLQMNENWTVSLLEIA